MIRVLVDGAAFRESLERDIAAARESVYLQTMSLEGDAAGRRLADALLAARCPEIRVLVDSFTRFNLSERFRFWPWNLLDRELRNEARRTERLFAELRGGGVRLRFTNPLRAMPHRLPARDHRKIVVIDRRIAYVGGINFTDHNFAWHDMMLRIDHAPAAEFLASDFLATWSGRTRAASAAFPGLDLHVLDGRSNEAAFREVLDRIEAARHRIWVQTPYLMFPFSERLAAAAERGVRVTVVSPEKNNQPVLKRYIRWAGQNSGMEVRLLPGPMSHLKAMLIDDRCLIAGSSNFDYLSYRLFQEVLAVVTDPDAVARFTESVVAVDQARSRVRPTAVPAIRRQLLDAQLRALGRFAVAIARI